MNTAAPLWLHIIGLAFFLFLDVCLWFMIFVMKELVEGHLINLGKGDWHQPVKRRGVEILWYLMLLGIVAGLSIVPSIGPMPIWKIVWASVLSFFVLSLLAAFVEYVRIMIQRTGIAYAAYDVIAWLAVLIGFGLIVALLFSPLRACV